MKTFMAILFALGVALSAKAQEPTQQNTSNSPPVVGKDEAKGEVDLAIEELMKRGETILSPCDPECKDPKQSITGGVLNGRAEKLVVPTYPAIARSAHAAGDVHVRVLIDKEGTVKAAQIVDGNPLLATPALRAARESRFSPTLLEGKPRNVVGIIVYSFVAQ